MSDRNRRLALGALGFGLLGLASIRAGWLEGLLPKRDLGFQPMEGLPGYRVLRSGAVSFGAGVPVFGLDLDKPAGLVSAEKNVARELEFALFGAGFVDGSAVPIAYFFDYQCPICRRLSPRLLGLQGVSIQWHDLAGLGPASEVSARAAIAARAQGAYAAFHERLMRARFQATESYVATLAESVGIVPERLLADMDSPETSARMWLSRALASKFGMAGTPGLVIGKSVVIGDARTREIERIVAEEKRRPR